MNTFELIFTYYDGSKSKLAVNYTSSTPPNRVYLTNLAKNLHRRQDLMAIKVDKKCDWCDKYDECGKCGSTYSKTWVYSQFLGAISP